MSSRMLRLSLGAVLTISFAASACDRPSDITSPSSSAVVATPQFSQNNSNDNVGAVGSWKDNGPPLNVSFTGSYSNVCKIDEDGGVCAVNGAAIYVPARAVKNETVFTIDLKVGPNVVVSLSASSTACWKNRPDCFDDVGSKGFKKPVTLVVSKFGATGKVVIQQLDKNKNKDKPLVTKDLGAWVSAEVSHFSEYILGEEK